MMSDESQENINEILRAHAEDATQLIGSTTTLKTLFARGLKLDAPVIETDEQYVNNLFEERKKTALKIIDELPNTPRIALPPIMFLYNEIKECMLFGLNGAAITLSAILIEFAIKHAIVDKNGGKEVYDKAEWDRVEKLELGPVIKEAGKLKLFDPVMINQLNHFKNTVRNPYLHYNIKKITSGATLSQAAAYNLETNKVETLYNLKADDNPFLWQISKEKVDEVSVIHCFNFADKVVRSLFPISDL